VNSVEAYIKEQLAAEIQRLSVANAQLVTDKIETEKIKVNLKANKVRLFGEKNSLITKKKELRIKIVVLNIIGLSNIPIRSHQDPLLNQRRNKFKAKRPLSFNNIKENFQRFFIKI